MPRPRPYALGFIFGSRVVLLDANDLEPFFQKLRSKPKMNSKPLRLGANGVFLSRAEAGDYTEARLIYSGRKHDDFPERDELIGFLYDQYHLTWNLLQSNQEIFVGHDIENEGG